jgi:hypothetical protein
MRAPEGAEHLQGRLGQRHIAVFLAFAVDVEQQAVAVDICYLQMPGMRTAASARRTSSRLNTTGSFLWRGGRRNRNVGHSSVSRSGLVW